MIIFALGVFKIKNVNGRVESGNIQHRRLWMMTTEFKDAEECVLQNQGDIFENDYNFALIEDVNVLEPNVPSGTYATVPKQWWYQANRKDDSDEIVSIVHINAPEDFEGICHWWVG
jgi:hypothetical protein